MKRTTRRRGRGAGWLAAALLAAALPAAGTEADVGRLVMGRTTYPAGSWALDSFFTYTAARLDSPASDASRFKFELERGLSERLSLGAGLKTAPGRRNAIQPGRLILGGRYLLVERPFQLAPFAEYLPSLRGQADEAEFGFEALKHFGPASLLAAYSGELEKAPGRARRLGSSLLLGPLYRFGLDGLAGAQWLYMDDGSHCLNFMLGGAVSRNIFLALEPRIGLERPSPDLELVLQLHLYFGPHDRGGWLLD